MLLPLLSGCSSVYFLYQAGRGQLQLMNRAKPLQVVIEDSRTDASLVKLLQKIPDMKKFGERNGLKPTPNYSEYVKLDQSAVVYVVTVSEALQFKAQLFNFPLVGSFNYIGWFKEKDARAFAAPFEAQGFDVDVRGASAYSTLGWFKDPLLSSMIPQNDNGKILEIAFPELLNVILHESVHATLYIKDQSYFNESIASFVAEVLTKKYYEESHLLESEEWKKYLAREAYSEKVGARMAQAYQDLKKIYDSTLADEEKRIQKAAYLKTMNEEMHFKRSVNNAMLTQYKTYNPTDPGFKELLKKNNEDVRAFLHVLSSLKPEDFKHPQNEELRDVLGKFYSM